MPPCIFSNRTSAFVYVLTLIDFIIMESIGFFMSVYVQAVLGSSLIQTATLWKRLSPRQLNLAIQAFSLVSIFFEGYDQGVMGGIKLLPTAITVVGILTGMSETELCHPLQCIAMAICAVQN